MKVILIFKMPHRQVFDEILSKSKNEQTKVLISEEIADQVKMDLPIMRIENDKKRKINYDILDRLLKFGDKRVNGKYISDHLSFADYASIWYYHKFRIYFLIRNKHYEIESITDLLNKYKEVEVYTDKNLDGYFDENVHLHRVIQSSKKDYHSMFHYALYFIVRNLFGLFKPLSKNVDYLVLDKGDRNPVIMPDLSTKKGNYNLEYLFRKLDKRFSILNEQDIPKFVKGKTFRMRYSSLKNMNKNTNLYFGEKVLFFGLLSPRIYKKYRQANRFLKTKYSELENQIHDPIEKDIIRSYKNQHTSSLYFVFRYLCYLEFFKKRKIKAVAGIDENSPLVKTIFDAAKARSIRTIGIQHGNIHDLHPAYLYTENDSAKKVYPDKTFIWGAYWKELLSEKGNYQNDTLIITGQIRTDIIQVLNKSQLKIFNNDRKNIVFASQPQRDPYLRYRAAEDVFTAMKNLGGDYCLQLKMHPGEAGDEDYYRNIAKKAGCNNFEIVGGFDLYQVIASCDVLITCFSTVGTETVYFRKPLIVLDHLRQDVQRYHREGVAVQATNAGKLEKYISDFCTGKLKIDEKAYSAFIGRYAYRIDGKVSERCVEQILGK